MTPSKPPFPNPDCRHPKRYSWPDNIATEHQVTNLVAAFVTALQSDYVVETGTYQAHTTHAIGRALADSGHGHLDTLEVDPGRVTFAREKLVGLPVTVHRTPSLEFTPRDWIDFAWLDSGPNQRGLEFHHFRPSMRTGATVGFHDTSVRHKVRPQVERLEAEGLIRVIYLPTWRGVAFAEVL